MDDKYYHSVRLEKDKCMGCTNCIKRCPTEAIRVHDGKATIIKSRCIDCGECIRACPHGAKRAVTDDFDMIQQYRYKVAMPAPALYSQYRTARSRNHFLTALKRLGFDDVFEVATGAEVISESTIEYLKDRKPSIPVISTACPAILRLIQVKYPNLLDNLLPLLAPVEAAAKLARERALEKPGIRPEDIGIFFITPCAAKMYTKYHPLRGEKSDIDGIISFQDIYMSLRAQIKALKEDEEEDLAEATTFGVRWPNPGGESLALSINKFIAVDGIHDAAEIFDTIENSDKFDDIDYIEALACKGGCLGGPLMVKNVYVSQVIMKSMRDEKNGKYRVGKLPRRNVDYRDYMWDKEINHIPIHALDSDIVKAMQKLDEMEKLIEEMPGLDCGACGAPSCKALAEDIVRGEAKITDCIFKLRERVRNLANEMFELESMLPPVMAPEQAEHKESTETECGGKEERNEAE